MPERENEKELILGNSQLISLFFVVVALCGVFFALGYMIGRNSTHPAVASLDGSAAGSPSASSPSPMPAPMPDRAREPETVRENPPADAAPAPAPESASAVQTQPAQGLPAAAPVPAAAPGKETPAPIRAAKPTPAAPASAPPAVSPSVSPAVSDVQPTEPGASYLQVAALRHDDAAKLARTLREQDLPARLAESTKPEIFRVLVGPYHQPAQLADAKAKLKSLGFANAFVQK